MSKKSSAMRTKKGNVTQKARKKSATLSKGGFPVFDVKSAHSALKLRGHAGPPGSKARNAVIAAATRYAPEAARRARLEDQQR